MVSRCWQGDRPITQGFSASHKGLDISMPNGTPLYAPENGSIYANVTVPERNGEKYNAFRSSDGKRVLICVHIGSFEASGQVKAGQLIGKSDNTGISTGSHTHFTYRVNGVETNPMDYLTGGGGDMNTPVTNEILYKYILGRPQGTAGDAGAATNLNKPLDEVLLFMYNGQEAVNYRAWVDSARTELPKMQSTIAEFQNTLSNQAKEIASLEKELDASAVKIAELEAKVVELSTPSTETPPTPFSELPAITFTTWLEVTRSLIKKWLGVS